MGDLEIVRRRARRAGLAALAAALFPSPANGAFFEPPESPRTALGLTVGLSWGDGSLGVALGLVAQRSYLDSEQQSDACDEWSTVGFGPQLGLLWLGDTDLVVIAGLQGGFSDGADSSGMTLEVGGAVHLADLRRGLHTGVVGFFGGGQLALRDEWLIGLHSLGLGLTFPRPGNPYGATAGSHSCAIAGRPLRAPDGARLPARTTDAPAGWATEAQAECDAVAAFLQVTDELLALGAPLPLVDAALDAAADEIVHALLCVRRAGGPRPVLPVVPARAPDLARLATESLADGLFNEGLAAARAATDPRRALSAEADRTLRRIASDEARHARLGAAIAGWALATGGEPVHDAVSDWLHASRAPIPS